MIKVEIMGFLGFLVELVQDTISIPLVLPTHNTNGLPLSLECILNNIGCSLAREASLWYFASVTPVV